MTENERAIQALKEIRDDYYEDDGYGNMTDECAEKLWAIDTAIEALKERKTGKTGKWIKDGHHIRCNRCDEYMCETDREGDKIPTNFCPNCGAEMEVEDG